MANPEVVFRGESVEVVKWDGLTSDSPGEEFLCHASKVATMQVEGLFDKVILEGNCGGPWEPIASFTMPGSKELSSGMVWVRPRVLGAVAKATIYLSVRR